MKIWIEGARPKTLIASISPVLIGTAIAIDYGNFRFAIFLVTLLFALAIQIGTNFANDYLDFLKGADTEKRKGPKRLVQSGLISSSKMRIVTFFTFLFAAILGIYLFIVGGFFIGVLAFFAIFFGYLYTGGPYPISYLGLGDLFVFIFFGPIAVAGTTFLQINKVLPIAILAGLSPGLLGTAILAMNNLRDVEQDSKVNKKTLPVRFGTSFGKWEITLCFLAAASIPLFLVFFTRSHFLTLASSSILFFALPLIRALFTESIPIASLFPKVGKIFALYTLLFTLGWLF